MGVVVGVIMGAGLVFGTFYTTGSLSPRTVTQAITDITTTTVTVFSETTISTAQCTILDPSQGVSVLVTDQGSPVAGANVSVRDVSLCSGGNPAVVADYVVMTNSSGWASMCGEDDGICYLTVHHLFDYSLSIRLVPGVLSDIHWDVSSGNVTVSYCSNGRPCN